jgi:SagB-type dehydrogenase family enzyme
MSHIGDEFQIESKYHRRKMSGKGLDWSSQPEIYKEYPDSKKIELPAVTEPSNLSLYEALQKRKSIRGFKSASISKEHLSYLLWASTGISRRRQGYEFRTAPSAGALYPIETYLVVNNVKELEEGIYHYGIRRHELEVLKKGSFGKAVCRAGLDQVMCAKAAVVFIWSAIFDRSKFKYGQRAYRYIYLDTGHMAENLALAAVSIDLGSCQIGALYDDEVNELIDIDGIKESVIYMSVIGYPALKTAF